MIFRKVFLILGLFLAYTGSSFASIQLENELDISSFFRSHKVIDNKIYLKPGTIYITSDQILLNLDGQLLPIGNLSVDAEGVFVTIEEIATAAKNEIWRCRWCQTRNSMEDRWCIKCGRNWAE